MKKFKRMMKIQKRYIFILILVFSIMSIIISSTAYFISNTVLVNKYKELYKSELHYMLSICESELQQLTDTFDFVDNNANLNKINDNSTIYEKLQASKQADEIMAALSTFQVIKYIINFTRVDSMGNAYWYGQGNNYSENILIKQKTSLIDEQKRKIEYVTIDKSVFRLVNVNKTLQFAKNIFSSTGEKNGYFYFELNPEYFKHIFKNYKPTVDSEIYLVDKNNSILYTNMSENIGSSINDINFYKNNSREIILNESLSQFGWSIHIKASKNQITRDNRIILLITLGVAFLSIILEILLIIIILRKLFKPIEKLNIGLRELTKGNREELLEVQRNDEIGEACNNFNILSKTLDNNIKKELDYQVKLREIEYTSLQYQINPHFIYNSLNSLKWMANIQKADNISKMVDSLWQLFKITSNSDGHMTTLKNEIELIKVYSYIQNIKYKHKFEIVYEIEDRLLDFKIPQFVLQPFVENSIFHGIAPKEGTGNIVIKAYYNEDLKNLIVSVWDDGVGMTNEKLKEIMSPEYKSNSGLGMNNLAVNNVIERMELLYNKKNLVYINSIIGKETKVIINIPR